MGNSCTNIFAIHYPIKYPNAECILNQPFVIFSETNNIIPKNIKFYNVDQVIMHLDTSVKYITFVKPLGDITLWSEDTIESDRCDVVEQFDFPDGFFRSNRCDKQRIYAKIIKNSDLWKKILPVYFCQIVTMDKKMRIYTKYDICENYTEEYGVINSCQKVYLLDGNLYISVKDVSKYESNPLIYKKVTKQDFAKLFTNVNPFINNYLIKYNPFLFNNMEILIKVKNNSKLNNDYVLSEQEFVNYIHKSLYYHVDIVLGHIHPKVRYCDKLCCDRRPSCFNMNCFNREILEKYIKNNYKYQELLLEKCYKIFYDEYIFTNIHESVFALFCDKWLGTILDMDNYYTLDYYEICGTIYSLLGRTIDAIPQNIKINVLKQYIKRHIDVVRWESRLHQKYLKNIKCFIDFKIITLPEISQLFAGYMQYYYTYIIYGIKNGTYEYNKSNPIYRYLLIEFPSLLLKFGSSIKYNYDQYEYERYVMSATVEEFDEDIVDKNFYFSSCVPSIKVMYKIAEGRLIIRYQHEDNTCTALMEYLPEFIDIINPKLVNDCVVKLVHAKFRELIPIIKHLFFECCSCFENKTNKAKFLCGNQNCNNDICNDCACKWFNTGENVIGKVVNMRSLYCMYCTKKPMVTEKFTNKIWQTKIPDSYDKTKYYAWCITCNSLKICGDTNCGGAKPTFTQYICFDCQKNKTSKICPSCGVAVEKEYGCNHIQCKCGSHWCYKCGYGGKTFTSGMIYEHMNAVHGGYFT
uniref:RING-type domain-containing protein n=1 Tax=viral metagenome TaxID=1070528 RepID=A0A6C0EDL6_9ZZZZ